MRKVYSFIIMNIGLILTTAGIVLFKIPNKFATGGVTGISIIINRIYPALSVGLLMLIINAILLTIGFMFTKFEFELKTIYSTIMLSALVWFLGKIYPINKPLTGDTLLELFSATILIAAGSAILFYENASTGGTDIIAKILNTKTHLHIGKTVLIVDLIISIFAVAIFGIKIGMYSILGVIIKGFIIDAIIGGLHRSKQVVIISSKADEIRKHIINKIGRGVTIYKAIGGNTNAEKQVLNTVVNIMESVKLRSYVKQIDDKAFITVSNVSEAYGRGFNNEEL